MTPRFRDISQHLHIAYPSAKQVAKTTVCWVSAAEFETRHNVQNVCRVAEWVITLPRQLVFITLKQVGWFSIDSKANKRYEVG